MAKPTHLYDESKIQTLSALEHIRKRTGMYIGRTGDGSQYEDGIYILLKEVIDNAVDEFIMGFGSTIEIRLDDGRVEDVVRRGLDLRYVSNNSTAHRETVSERLAGLGLPAGAERVLTSGFVTGRWLRDRLPLGSLVLVVGEAGLMRELREAGLAPYHAGEAPGAEVVEGVAGGPPVGRRSADLLLRLLDRLPAAPRFG